VTTALDLRDLNRTTLARQGLLRRFEGPVDATIGRLAGLQAQHADMPYIALWSRLEGLTVAAVEAALEARAAVKATVMRSTLHLVAAADYPAYDAAIASARVATWASTARKAGLDLAELHASLLAFCHEPRTVAEMEARLDTLAPDTDIQRHAPGGVTRVPFRMASAGGGLVHVPPSGFWKAHGKPRYIDARVWLGKRYLPLEPADALDRAVSRYLGAYGPATEADVGRWLGQSRRGVIRAALGRLRASGMLVDRRTTDGIDLVDVVDGELIGGDVAAPPRFLSRWDSGLISYDDRRRLLPDAYTSAVAKPNADFLPTFLVDGFVAGLWSVTEAGGTATIRLEPFASITRPDRAALEEEAGRLVRFVAADAGAHAVHWAD
jgi:hypothetical protein